MDIQDKGIGTLIKMARKQKHLSARELGERLSPPVTHGAVYGWESGKNKPNADTVWQISEILEIDLRSFFPESEEELPCLDLKNPLKTDIEAFENFYSRMNETQRKAVLCVARAMVDC